jgi:hypothetical protein
MKKLLVAILVILLIAGAILWYFLSFRLDAVIKEQIELAGSRSLGTPVTVGSVTTDLRNGSLAIASIRVANPPGFENEFAISLNGIEAALDYGNFDVKRVIIDKPEIVIEERDGETNFSMMLAQVEQAPAEPEPGADGETAPEIVIHHFRMNESRASFESKSMDRYTDLEVDEIELRNLRGTPVEVSRAIAEEILSEVVSEAAKELLKAKAAEKIDDLFGRDRD